MANKNNFYTGLTELIFLSILDQGDSYVYDIMKMIEEYSDGLLKIPPNTIYTAAYKLEQEEMISEYSKIVGRKRRRIYYHLEPKGKDYLDDIAQQYKSISQGVDKFYQVLDEKGLKQEA